MLVVAKELLLPSILFTDDLLACFWINKHEKHCLVLFQVIFSTPVSLLLNKHVSYTARDSLLGWYRLSMNCLCQDTVLELRFPGVSTTLFTRIMSLNISK